MKIDFEISKKETLRYAGYTGKDVDSSLGLLADSIIENIREYLAPKCTSGLFYITPVENGVMLEGTGVVLLGKDIKKHLENCDRCYMICATAGMQTDSFIRTNMALGMVHGLLADGAATRAVEAFCDKIENDLREKVVGENGFLTHRYSPGYGDFPFTQQPDILKLLQAEKLIGVTANESCIMTPSKSVTAVMGVARSKPADREVKCENCPNRENCNFSCR